MKRLFIICLVLLTLMPIHTTFAETLSVMPEDGESNVSFTHIDEEAENRLDQYIAEFDLSEECKNVIIEYLPDVNSFAEMEQEGTLAYSLIMDNGTKYYMIVSVNNEPVCLMSSEKDYDARTRYYDKHEMEKRQKAEANVSYIGNANSLKLHYPSCESVKKMKEKNKVEFSSKEEALNQGYTACKKCKP